MLEAGGVKGVICPSARSCCSCTVPIVKVLRALIGLLITATFAGQAVATSRSTDGTSTKRFIAAADRFLGVAVGRHGAEEASADALIDRIFRRCPRSLSSAARTGSAAQQRTWGAFTSAAGLELAISEFDVLRPAARRELTSLGSLRWTIPALERAILGYVRAGRAFLALHPPDLCAETAAASVSHFTVTPPPIAQFVRLGRASAEASQPSLSGLLNRMKAFVMPDETSSVTGLHQLDKRLDQLNSAFGLKAYLRMVKALSGV